MGWWGQPWQTLFREGRRGRGWGCNDGLGVGGDHEFWLRMARLGPVTVVPQPLVEHLLHLSQVD